MPELSVQLYTLRNALEADFNGTLQKLADFGFTQVEPFQLVAYGDRLRTRRERCSKPSPD